LGDKANPSARRTTVASGFGVLVSRSLRILPLLCVSFAAGTAGAGNPNLARYPLRIHVLASDETHKTPRMSPGDSVACDAIEGITDSISPNPGGPVTLTGLSGDLCSLHPEMITGRLLDVQDSDPAFSGEGRGDLVSPPTTTQGFSFHYDNCSRIRVHPGFQSLPARWKQPRKKLEVLIPSDDIPEEGRPLPPVRCTFSVTMHDSVYLLLRNGRLIEVSQDAYRERPALRVFLSGTTEAVQRRQEFTEPAHPGHE
jgi:hypothetical protein